MDVKSVVHAKYASVFVSDQESERVEGAERWRVESFTKRVVQKLDLVRRVTPPGFAKHPLVVGSFAFTPHDAETD
jgi:hypothetical protein